MTKYGHGILLGKVHCGVLLVTFRLQIKTNRYPDEVETITSRGSDRTIRFMSTESKKH
jgi:hypothetical protein